MKVIHPLILMLCLFLVSSVSFSQNDSLAKADSTALSIAKGYNQTLRDLEKQRILDSIERAQLEAKINSLSESDMTQRQKLEQELFQIKEKELRRLDEKQKQIDALKKTVKGYPVFGFFSDTLFLIHSKLGSFSAKERADAVFRRIKKLPNSVAFTTDSLKIIESETVFDVVHGERIIMSVTENDALWNNTSQYALAQDIKVKIGAAVEHYQKETSVLGIITKIGLALLVLVVIGFLVRYVSRLFKWTATKIKGQKGKRFKGLKFNNYTFFDSERQVGALLFLNKIVKWVTIVFAIYIALPVIFGMFPWTENFAGALFGYILNPAKKILISFWNYLPNLATILVIFIIFRYVLKGIKYFKSEIEQEKLTIPGFYPDWAKPTYQLVRIILIAFVFVVIFPYLPGSDSPVFQGVSVFLGFLFTFGSAGSLSNIIAGLILTYMRLFKIGDRVKIGDVFGDVIEKTTLVTRVRTIKNEIISIPNSSVMSSHTINYSSDATDKGLIVHTTVTIGYDIPWQDMHATLIEAAQRTELILDEPSPFVLQTSLDDFYVSYQINGYTREPTKQAIIYSNLHQHIQDVCNERGIEILSPHYRAARDGNTSTIPASYLPKGYKAPSFNLNISKEDKPNTKETT